jgi:meiotically up-regulated gene 157 (Mug157) protein
MALAMQGLTSEDPAEIETMISYMTATTAGTYVMHEAFNADNPSQYSRDWFTWPCALYAHLYLTEILNIDLITEELS